ncbi:MAG: hypothetical protein U1C74_17640, partial [Phenylobacterium sp.]|nr:hypothetical protein [Phenylobacterium sp.]
VAKLAPRAYGTLKAQEPGSASASEANEDRKVALAFTVRRFGVTPDQTVVDLTWAGEGMDEDGRAALRAGVMRGEITEGDLARLTAAARRRALGLPAGADASEDGVLRDGPLEPGSTLE